MKLISSCNCGSTYRDTSDQLIDLLQYDAFVNTTHIQKTNNDHINAYERVGGSVRVCRSELVVVYERAGASDNSA